MVRYDSMHGNGMKLSYRTLWNLDQGRTDYLFKNCSSKYLSTSQEHEGTHFSSLIVSIAKLTIRIPPFLASEVNLRIFEVVTNW